MENLNILQALAVTPRYRPDYSELLLRHIKSTDEISLVKRTSAASGRKWVEDDGFQANVVIQVDVD